MLEVKASYSLARSQYTFFHHDCITPISSEMTIAINISEMCDKGNPEEFIAQINIFVQ